MMYFVIMAIFLIGCSTPQKTILMSQNPKEENWESVWDHMDVELSTEKKGAFLHTKWLDLMVGKVGGGTRLDDKQRVDRLNPTKKIWGVKFIKRFYEPFSWKIEDAGQGPNSP